MKWFLDLYRHDAADFAIVCFVAGALYSAAISAAVIMVVGVPIVVLVSR